ncbi:MAG: hypothetical protein IJK97_12550, partial [Thermoguttaceae bacterium]|nr:hypothetical protein [Thermoguttaceae bacterium]
MKARFLPVLLVVLFVFAALFALSTGMKAQSYTSRTAPAQSQPKYKVWTNPGIQPETVPEVKTELPVQGPVRTAPSQTSAARNTPATSSEMEFSAPQLKPALNEKVPAASPTLTKEERAQKAVADLVASEIKIVGEKNSENASRGIGEKTGEKNFWDVASWVSPEGIQGSALTVLIISAVSLAPAFLMMTTSFVRIFVVLGILRHGFGTQGIPGTQVLAALALFMTFF